MPRFTQVGLEARSRLVSSGKGYQERAPFREALAGLDNDRTLEIEPDQGERLQTIRVRLRRAAKEVGREIQVGETQEGTLLVWLADAGQPVRRRRRRRSTDQQQGTDLPVPQGAMLG